MTEGFHASNFAKSSSFCSILEVDSLFDHGSEKGIVTFSDNLFRQFGLCFGKLDGSLPLPPSLSLEISS